MFQSTEFQALFARHQLDDFDALWSYNGPWFEDPNIKRGGWSGVNYLELADAHGQLHGFFLKRQENYQRKTWRHPVVGEPTFVREYQILQFLNTHPACSAQQSSAQPSSAQSGITPALVFFGQKNKQCILMTKALTGYLSADEWLKKNPNASEPTQNTLLKAMANTVKKMHLAGVQHRALYLKHLFVKPIVLEQKNAQVHFEAVLIDFEKSRITKAISLFKWADLIKLHQRSPDLAENSKLSFLLSYLNRPNLSKTQQLLWRYFQR